MAWLIARVEPKTIKNRRGLRNIFSGTHPVTGGEGEKHITEEASESRYALIQVDRPTRIYNDVTGVYEHVQCISK